MSPWCCLTFILIAVTAGCRGPYPLARSVQVTHDPAVEVPEFDAPPQRLATAKPRVGSEGLRKSSVAIGQVSDTSDYIESDGAVAAVNHIDDSSAAMRSVSTSTTKTMQYAADAYRTAVNMPATSKPVNRSVVREGNTQVESVHKSISSDPRLDSAQNDRSHSEENVVPLSTQLPPGAIEMLEEFKNCPPEIQQQALRQLQAMSQLTMTQSRAGIATDSSQNTGVMQASFNDTATSSTQPSNDKLSFHVAHATDESTKAGATASLSHQSENPKTDRPESKAVSHVSDAEVHVESLGNLKKDVSPTQAATKVERTGAESSLSHRSETKPAASPPQDPVTDSITSTLSAPSVTATPSTTSADPPTKDQGDDKLDVAVLTESQLYSELLNRLGKPAPDETDAARSRRLVMLRHLMVLAGNVDEAVSQIEGMAKNEQEYLRHQLLGLWTIIDPDGHPVPGRRFSSALPQLREATTQLAAATDSLDVRSLAFCTEIESYGQIKPFPSTRFKPGQQVILYCEIENFVASKVATGYETNLQGSYDVFNEAGDKVASQLLPADRQVSNNYLRDYFIAYQMYLPKDLDSGKYRMQLTIEDLNGKKYGQSMISFELAR